MIHIWNRITDFETKLLQICLMNTEKKNGSCDQKNVSSKVFLSLYYFISTLAKKVYEKKPVGLFQISLLEIENKFKLWLMPIFSLFSLKSCQEQNSKLEKKQLGPLPMQHLEVKMIDITKLFLLGFRVDNFPDFLNFRENGKR